MEIYHPPVGLTGAFSGENYGFPEKYEYFVKEIGKTMEKVLFLFIYSQIRIFYFSLNFFGKIT